GARLRWRADPATVEKGKTGMVKVKVTAEGVKGDITLKAEAAKDSNITLEKDTVTVAEGKTEGEFTLKAGADAKDGDVTVTGSAKDAAGKEVTAKATIKVTVK